jgi:CelD/BcsL family acetyltransferase involved in cellulose biosynthesis
MEEMHMNVHAAWAVTDAVYTAAPVTLRFDPDRAEWDALEARAPFPHLPQNFAYAAGRAATGWRLRRTIFEQDGRPVAYAAVLEKHLAGMRVLTRVNRGPILLDAVRRPETIRAIYAALRRRWRGPLLIAPALSRDDANDAALREAGFRIRQRQGWQSARIDLTRSEDEIWAGFASTFRNRYRQAAKAGAGLRIATDAETYEWMLARHLANMRAKQFHGPGTTLLRGLRETAPENVTVFQLIASDAPVAGMSVVRFGTHAEYHIGWFGEDGRRLNAGNFLMWEIMKEMKRRGVATYDVGGMRPGDGYTRFKETMRPVPFTLVGEWMSFW